MSRSINGYAATIMRSNGPLVYREWKHRYPHHEFLRDLRHRWGAMWRVRLGKERGSNGRIPDWCSENLVGEYARSEGREVYYFQEEQDSILFQVRFS